MSISYFNNNLTFFLRFIGVSSTLSMNFVNFVTTCSPTEIRSGYSEIIVSVSPSAFLSVDIILCGHFLSDEYMDFPGNVYTLYYSITNDKYRGQRNVVYPVTCIQMKYE